MTDDLKAPETDDIKLRLRGRAAHLYDRGEIKSPSIMIEAADRIATLEAALADMTQQRDAAMAGAVKTHYYCTDCSAETSVNSENRCLGCGGGRVMATYRPDPDRMLALTAAAYEDAAQTAADRCAACGCREIASLVKEHVIRRIPANASAALSRIEAQAEARVLAVARQAHETLIEINSNNYTHGDVVKANDAVVEAIFLLADLIGETHGYSSEWWKQRRSVIADATEAAAKGGV